MRRCFLVAILFGVTLSTVMFLGAASETIRTVQQALVDKGMDPGPVDGLMGSKTRQAIRDFQE